MIKTLALKWQREYHLTIKGKNNGRPRISRSPKSDSEIPTSTKDWMRKRMMEVHLTQKTQTHLPVKMAKLLSMEHTWLAGQWDELDMLELDKNVTARQQISVYAILIKKFACSYPHIWKVGVQFFSLAPLMNHVLSPFLKSRRRSWPEPFSSDNIKKETTAK